jgi:hypothetical protein
MSAKKNIADEPGWESLHLSRYLGLMSDDLDVPWIIKPKTNIVVHSS